VSDIFPSIQPEIEETAAEQLPLCREIAWDFGTGTPIFSGGRPVVVTAAEAVKVWVWKALKTARCRYDIYTWDFGCEAEILMGKPFTPEVKQSEAIRYVREALAPNPYITQVRQTDVTFSGCQLEISCTVQTIYGEVSVNV
jgi:hypothetical protein